MIKRNIILLNVLISNWNEIRSLTGDIVKNH